MLTSVFFCPFAKEELIGFEAETVDELSRLNEQYISFRYMSAEIGNTGRNWLWVILSQGVYHAEFGFWWNEQQVGFVPRLICRVCYYSHLCPKCRKDKSV